MNRSIFISHSHYDRDFAVALQALLAIAVPDVKVEFSSDPSPDGGPRTGEPWRAWVQRCVKEGSLGIVILTPSALRSEWVLWEAGLVQGAHLTRNDSASPLPLRPLTFGLSNASLPDTLKDLQSISGDDENGLHKFLGEIMGDFGVSAVQATARTREFNKAIPRFKAEVDRLSRELPAERTEAVIQEWCARLDQLAVQQRQSESLSLHRWILAVFRVREDEPIDMRLHRRLGELYLRAKRAHDAIRQFELALKSAPRDIFLLRRLGIALLETKDFAAVDRVIQRIETVDPEAFVQDPESAALKGRLHRERADLPGALAVYRKAVEANPSSFYLARNAAELALRVEGLASARALFLVMASALLSSGDSDHWALEGLVTSAIADGNAPLARKQFERLNSLSIPPRDVGSIMSGWTRLADAFQPHEPKLADSFRSFAQELERRGST